MAEQRLDMKQELSGNRREALRAIMLDYSLQVISCQSWRNPAPWKLAWRSCPDAFLLFPVEGHVRLRLSGTDRILVPGEFLMLDEGIRHAAELVEGFPVLRQISIHCQIHDRWRRSLLHGFSSPFGQLPLEAADLQILRELCALLEGDPDCAQVRGAGFVRELLAAQLSRGLTFRSHPSSGDARVGAVIQEMGKHFHSPNLSVEALAAGVRITPVQLRKIFRRETGSSPRRYLNAMRLRESVRMLRSSSASVKEVAAACGYASDHYFHLVFRQKYGCTPTAFRERSYRQL